MEIFPAADVEQFEYIKKVIDECDYYVLIIGARYGSVDVVGVSFTEKEYDYAVDQKKTVLGFIHGNPGSIPISKADTSPALVKHLTAFCQKVSRGRLVQFWQSRDDLKSKIIIALSKTFTDAPGVGWIRADVAASDDLLAQNNQLKNKLDALEAKNDELRLQITPLVENIAGLNDPFTVRYHYQRAGSTERFTATVTNITWGEIFMAVGPELIRPSAPGKLSDKLRSYLRENKSISNDFSLIHIFESDANTIKMHLIALGLVRAEAAKRAGGGLVEFISLTERGTKQLVELMAVRSKGESNELPKSNAEV
jgi:hypothetical protein